MFELTFLCLAPTLPSVEDPQSEFKSTKRNVIKVLFTERKRFQSIKQTSPNQDKFPDFANRSGFILQYFTFQLKVVL